MDRANVLITSIGSNTSIGVAKCLKKYYNIVGVDLNEHYECSGFKFVDKYYKICPASNPNFEEELLNIISSELIQCVIAIHDKELELISQFKHKYKHINWAVNDYEVIRLCNNKNDVNKFVSDICNVPLQSNLNLDLKGQIIVKPSNGVSSNGIEIYNSLKDVPSIYFSDDFVIQEYKQGIEFTVDCYSSYIGDDFIASARVRKETKSGMSVKSEIVQNPELIFLCKSIHSKLNYKGTSNIQFILSDGCYYFIEINPRFAGAGILTYFSGYNFPLFTMYELVDKKLIDFTQVKLAIGNKMVRFYCETFFNNENIII